MHQVGWKGLHSIGITNLHLICLNFFDNSCMACRRGGTCSGETSLDCDRWSVFWTCCPSSVLPVSHFLWPSVACVHTGSWRFDLAPSQLFTTCPQILWSVIELARLIGCPWSDLLLSIFYQIIYNNIGRANVQLWTIYLVRGYGHTSTSTTRNHNPFECSLRIESSWASHSIECGPYQSLPRLAFKFFKIN